jgi:hypothetical protein
VTAADRCGGDAGRAAVLEAEEAAFGGTDADAPLPWSDLVARGRAVTAAPWWAAAGGPPVELHPARAGARTSSANGSTAGGDVVICISEVQQTAATLAHELAHALAGVASGHDARFRAAHVDVVTVLAGEQLADHLRAAYRVFDLVVGERPWPAPQVASGAGFVWRFHR